MIYALVRGFISASVKIYFRTINVSGRERIPSAGPAVLVSNHPNSVIDAFLLGTQLTGRRINFIAKDSIPALPVVGPLLRKCGVIGVARRIDYPGEIKQTHGKNLKAIHTCTPHLERGEIVTIFGEGVSTDSRKLGVIKKGAIRIGYNAEEQNNFHLGVTFVPVGINYSDKVKFRSAVLIEMGVPFRLTDIARDPRVNSAKVLLDGTRRLQESIEHVVVNLEHESLGPLLDEIGRIVLVSPESDGDDAQPLAEYFEKKRRLAEWIEYVNQTDPKFLEHVQSTLRDYGTLLRRMHIDDGLVAGRIKQGDLYRSVSGLLAGSFGSLISLYGWLNNLFPRYLGRFARRFGRQREFARSREDGGTERLVVARETLAAHYGGWAGALVGYPLQVVLVGWLAAGMTSPFAGIAAGAIYLLTLVPSWKFSLVHGERVRHHFGEIRIALTSLTRRLTLARLRRRRTSVVRTIERALAGYDALRPERR